MGGVNPTDQLLQLWDGDYTFYFLLFKKEWFSFANWTDAVLPVFVRIYEEEHDHEALL